MINDGFEPLFDSVFVNSDYEELDDDVDDNTDSLASLRNDDDSGNSESEDEEEQNGCDNDEIDAEWSNVVVARGNSPLDESSLGFQSDIMLTCKDPVDFYELFMVDVWELIVKETNIYGYQKHPGWEPITMEDMKKFIGLCLQMGVVQLPHLKNYWSNNPAFGKYPIGPDVMSRERFEKILTHLHLADNSNYDGSDRLFKISRLIELINRNCKAVCRPGKEVYINRSMPFTGRVLFRQRTPHKKLRYDVKLFKLCSERGYTYKMLAYADKNHNRAGHLAERVVMTLMDDLLDEGRHLYIDKWFTSVSLAESLLRRNTYLTGMCKKNRFGLPKDIIQRKLSKGQWAAKQKENGVMVLRWKDTQDIIILSTAHDISLIPNTSKPEVVESYRKRKASMDSSAQMTSYSPYSTRSNKWYVRLFFHLVTHICLVNAWRVYSGCMRRIEFNEFKWNVYLRYLRQDDVIPQLPTSRILEKIKSGPAKSRRCVECYKKLREHGNSRYAAGSARRVRTRCSQCKKHICLECFYTAHQKCRPSKRCKVVT